MADVRARMRAAQAQRAALAAAAAGASGGATAAAATSAAAAARVVSPWVRYTALGQLACTACHVVIKNEVLWPPHAASNKHKEAVAAALAERAREAAAAAAAASTNTNASAAARSAGAAVPSALGALTGYADDDDDESTSGPAQSGSTSGGPTSSGPTSAGPTSGAGGAFGPEPRVLPHPTRPDLRIIEEEVVEDEDEDENGDSGPARKRPAVGDDEDEQDEEAVQAAAAVAPVSKWARVAEEATRVRMDSLPQYAAAKPAGDASAAAEDADEPAGPLPSDFYDEGRGPEDAKSGGSKKKKKAGKGAAGGEADDEEVDKAEWERFRRAIHQESAVSAQLQEADLLEMMQDRDERLAYEHAQLRERFEALRAKKAAMVPLPAPVPAAANSAASDDDDDEDLDPDALFNWRSKGV